MLFPTTNEPKKRIREKKNKTYFPATMTASTKHLREKEKGFASKHVPLYCSCSSTVRKRWKAPFITTKHAYFKLQYLNFLNNEELI